MFSDVTILAILQGIAEFLPISSSGHLVLGRQVLGLGEMGLRLDVFLHVGTLFAIAVFYWKVIARILLSRDWTYLAKIVASAVPAGLVGILFKDQIETAFAAPKMVGGALVFTGLVLTLTKVMKRVPASGTGCPVGSPFHRRPDSRTVGSPFHRRPDSRTDGGGTPSLPSPSWLATIAMGVAQAVAIIPGVSRSGMTLAAARGAKVEPAKSAEFSFLMSAPPIAGAALLELKDGFEAAASGTAVAEVPWGLVVYGGLLAAVVGYFALAVLLKSLKSDRFWMFGPYCILAGIVTVAVAK